MWKGERYRILRVQIEMLTFVSCPREMAFIFNSKCRRTEEVTRRNEKGTRRGRPAQWCGKALSSEKEIISDIHAVEIFITIIS